MSEWRLVVGSGIPGADGLDSDGARNMAVDDTLFDAAKRGGIPALRFYRWTPGCLSLGRNQPARGRYDADARLPGRDIVRRPTGGLAVYHDVELTYSVACPVGALGSPRATYLRLHRIIARALARLGIEATLSGRAGSRTRVPADASGVCFAAPAEGEILAAAGKLVGSAQRTEARTILQHGSILIAGSQAPAAARQEAQTAARSDEINAQSSTLKALLGRQPDDAELIALIRDSFEAETGIRLAPATLLADEVDRLPTAEARYRSAEWTWRT